MINEVVLKKYFCEKRQDYTVLEILNLEGAENFNIVRQSKIGILDLKKNIVGIEFYNNNNNNNIKKIELQIMKEIFDENNIYIFDFNDINNPKILNKSLIIENINKNLFKFFQNRNEFSVQIHLTIYNLKKLISKKNYLEILLFTESPISFLFLDIYNQKFNYEKKIEIEYLINTLLIDEITPLKLIFKINEKYLDTENIKLNFKMDYDSNKMSKTLLISKIREKINKKMWEKITFNLEIFGYYILDKNNFQIKEIEVIKILEVDGRKYREYFKIDLVKK